MGGADYTLKSTPYSHTMGLDASPETATTAVSLYPQPQFHNVIIIYNKEQFSN